MSYMQHQTSESNPSSLSHQNAFLNSKAVLALALTAILSAAIGGVAATKLIKGYSAQNKVTSLTVITPSPSVQKQATFIPQPTVPPGVDKDNVYSNTVEFGFSFKHLDEYTVTRTRSSYNIRKIDPNDRNAPSFKDPNSLAFRFVKFNDIRTDKSTPYTKEDVYKWIDTWSNADQCYYGSKTSEVVMKNKQFYKVEIYCKAPDWYKIHYVYLLELHKRSGDFLRIDTNDSPQSEQLNLFLDTFTLIN